MHIRNRWGVLKQKALGVAIEIAGCQKKMRRRNYISGFVSGKRDTPNSFQSEVFEVDLTLPYNKRKPKIRSLSAKVAGRLISASSLVNPF